VNCILFAMIREVWNMESKERLRGRMIRGLL
jgi:hypothetical protein